MRMMTWRLFLPIRDSKTYRRTTYRQWEWWHDVCFSPIFEPDRKQSPREIYGSWQDFENFSRDTTWGQLTVNSSIFWLTMTTVVKWQKQQFTDYCGSWLKSSLKGHYYLKSNFGNFEYIYKKQSIFFKRKNGKMIPLTPQPDLNSLVVLQRYHSKL